MFRKQLGVLRDKPRLYVLVGVAIILIVGCVRLVVTLTNSGASNQVVGIGFNNLFQLGGRDNGRDISRFEALQLDKETATETYKSVKAGHYHTLLLTEKGKVYSIGTNQQPVSITNGDPRQVRFPSLKPGEHIAAIDTSRDHNIALSNFGRVYTWGSNYTGQLGDGTNTDRKDPVLVTGVPEAVQVAAGYRHSVVIDRKGDLYAWGGSCNESALSEAQVLIEQAKSNITALGGYGSTVQADLKSHDVGDCTTQASTFVQSKKPKKLKGMAGRAVEISAGYGHLLVLNDEGELFSGGCNTYKQLGRTKGTDSSTKNDLEKVNLPQKAVSVAAGFRHSAVIMGDGDIFAWGYNGPGGHTLVADSKESTVSTPARIKTPGAFTFIEAAHDTTFAVSDKGKVIGWGQDDAQAFWGPGSLGTFREIATLDADNATLSAGMVHLVSLQGH